MGPGVQDLVGFRKNMGFDSEGGGNCRGLWAEEGHAGVRVLTRALWWPWWGEQTAE